MSRREKREAKQSNKTFRKIFIVAIFLAATFLILAYAPNFAYEEKTGETTFIVNNQDITDKLRKPLIMEDGIVYLSKEDIQNFFDPYVYYDTKYKQIITGSDTKIASIVVGENKMNNNGSDINIDGTILERNDTYYIPFSELNDIYHVKISYIENTGTVVVDSLDRKYVVADTNKEEQVKYKPTSISKNIEKLEKGDTVTVVTDSEENGWVAVRTENGRLGYVKSNTLANESVIRENLVEEKQIEGKVSMAWDYFSEYGQAPSRSGKIKGVNVVSPTFFTLERLGKGKVNENVGEAGKAYIKWAHDNEYKVWASFSNNSMIDTTSEILNDYNLRQKLINKIVSLVVNYELDGINIDFENMYVADKELFSRFIIELTPRLREIGAVVSVDITAPDGSDTWSMCYDRHTLGKVADYIVFMAYDQNGISSPVEGTTAGCDWVEVNVQKLVGTQEEISSDKLILGVPFYTRVWKTTGEKTESVAVNMKDLPSIIPSDASKNWDDSLKQYVVEYTKDGTDYKIWIEDEKSISAKMDLIEKYKLGGAAYWAKDREPSDIWDMISEKLGIE